MLAVGAELKSTVSVAKEIQLVCSHHIGDLEHLATYQAFLQATLHLCRLFGVEPEVVAHDLHPEYLSTKHALDLDLEPWPVQHHHAHIASCMAEHGTPERCSASPSTASATARMRPCGAESSSSPTSTDSSGWATSDRPPCPAGRRPSASLGAWPCPGQCSRSAMTPRPASVRRSTADGTRFSPSFSLRAAKRRSRPSVGRLFDAVAALLGLRSRVTYEGQAAIELEMLARSVPRQAARIYPVELSENDGLEVLDPSPLVATVLEEMRVRRGSSLDCRRLPREPRPGNGRARRGWRAVTGWTQWP